MDPLSVLRDFVINKQLDQVVTDADRVHFGDQYSFSKTAFTTFKSNKGDYYTLEEVVFFYLNIGAGLGEYVRRSTQQGVSIIAVADRKPLRDYLEGTVDAASLPQIADAVPAYPDSKRAAAPTDLEPAAKRAKPAEADGEASALLLLAQQERQLRDRNSMLLAPNCSFEKVLSILDKATRTPQQPRQQPPQAARQPVKAAPKPAAAQPPLPPEPAPPTAAFLKPSGRTERDTTKDAYRAMGVDASLANDLGLGYSNIPESLAVPPPPPPPLQANGREASHKAAGPSGTDADKAAAVKPSKPRPAAPAAKPAAARPSSSKPGKAAPSSGPPIVLVPTGMTAMINMYNAQRFLEKGEFVRSDAAYKANPTKAQRLTYYRTQLRQKPVKYEVTDKEPPKGSPEWNRVVAVVVQGKPWQFKDWPHKGADKGDLVEAFNQVLGVYVHYKDEAIPADTVKQWKVKRIPIHRDNRHLDKTAALDFYRALDEFLKSQNSTLTY